MQISVIYKKTTHLNVCSVNYKLSITLIRYRIIHPLKLITVMQWSLERIIPLVNLGDNRRMMLIKEYLKSLKEKKTTKNGRS